MEETIEQIMTRNIFMIDASSPLSEAREMFDSYPIRHLPVVSEDQLVGILSKTDIVRLSFANSFGTEEDVENAGVFDIVKVEDVMTERPLIVNPTDPIRKVCDIFINEEFHALPVSDDNGLVGIITSSDIIRHQKSKLVSGTIPEKYTEQRPWGCFEQFCQNTPCTVKIINVNPNEELSLQYHEHRNEFWRVIEGEGIVVIGEDERFVKEKDELFIPARTKHQIKTTYSPLQVLEISFGQFDEKDIVRLKDKYQRVKEEIKIN